MVILMQVFGLPAIGSRIGISPLYTALTTVLSAIRIGIGMQRRTLIKFSIVPVMLTVAPESTALAVVRNATSSDFGACGGERRSLSSDFASVLGPKAIDFFSFTVAV